MIDLRSNDYLGLKDHPEVRAAAIAAVGRYGVGAAANRSAATRTGLTEQLEKRLAVFKGAPAALTFQSGYVANIGALPALLSIDDLVLHDELCHNSTLDGIRLSGATARTFAHRDADDLERRLHEIFEQPSEAPKRYRSVVVATDGVFGSTGEIAPLPALCAVAERYEALVVVDDAHATGVLGPTGRGTIEHFGLTGRVHLQVGTLSKAFGSFGGFVVGRRQLCEDLAATSRPLLHSTTLPAAILAASLAAIEIVEREPHRREQLWVNTHRLRNGLQRLGFDTGTSETPIIPVHFDDLDTMRRFVDDAGAAGLLLHPIPGTWGERPKIRIIASARLDTRDLDAAIATLDRIGRDLAVVL